MAIRYKPIKQAIVKINLIEFEPNTYRAKTYVCWQSFIVGFRAARDA